MIDKDFALTSNEIDNFLRKVQIDEVTGCWNWTGWTNSSGHARVDLRNKKYLVSHVAMLAVGKPRPAPPNDNALHGDNCSARCCNPEHLRWGTHKQNSADRERLGRREPARGERSGMAKLSEEQVIYARSRTDLSQREVAKELGVSQPLIGAIRRRQIWTHLP